MTRPLHAAVALVAVVLVFAAPAAAHTGFESSDPADGATTPEPVAEVTISFSGPAEPAGEGFRALDASGVQRAPVEASSTDGQTWVLRFDPPLAGGEVGIRWTVAAPDAHPIDGSFVFAAGGEPAVGGADGSTEDLDAFLDGGGTDATAAAVAATGRMLSIVGAVLGIGALVFAALVLQGGRSEVRHVVFWVRRGGVLVVCGALVELVGQVGVEAGGFGPDWAGALWDALRTSTGLAIVLRLAGGVALVAGVHPDSVPVGDRRDPLAEVGRRAGRAAAVPPDRVVPADAAVGAVVDDATVQAWVARRRSAGAVVGALLLAGSFAFDGHTTSKGPRALHALVDVTHVVAVSVWVGGVAMLAVVAWHRHRAGRPLDMTPLAVRFSVLASAALVAVGVTGTAMAVIVLDGPGELVSTPWGRLLVVKVLLVAGAGAAGAYNHERLLPAMADRPDDPALMAHFRAVVTAEAAVLLGAGLVTAWLVGAAS